MSNTPDNDHLRTYFVGMGRALNASGLETDLHLGRRMVRHWLKKERGLNDEARAKLLAWARRRGYHERTQYDFFL